MKLGKIDLPDFASAVAVIGIATVCLLFARTAYDSNRPLIEEQARRRNLAEIEAVLPLPHDNDLLADRIAVRGSGELDGHDLLIYRGRLRGQAVGLVMGPVYAAGYSGPIELMVGIDAAGRLTGVRIRNHRETPDLGGTAHQEKSGWLLDFAGRSLNNTPASGWSVRSEGGDFDQLSGATITARGIIRAVRHCLDYYASNRDTLYL
jgi:electron transport complex protein RnfG